MMDTMQASGERFSGDDITVDCAVSPQVDSNVGHQSDPMFCLRAAQNVQIGANNQLFIFSAFDTSPRSEGNDPSPVTSDNSSTSIEDTVSSKDAEDTQASSMEVHQHGASNHVNVILPDQRYSLSDVIELIRRLELVQQPGSAATETTVRVRIELVANNVPGNSEGSFLDTTLSNSEGVPQASNHTSSTGVDKASTHTNVEEAARRVMRRSKRLKSFFEGLRIRITNIFRGSIVLELKAESPESLKNLLKNLEKLDSVLVEELKDESVLKNIQGNVLQMKISIIIPDGMVEASGITDLKQFMTELHTQAGVNISDGPSTLKVENMEVEEDAPGAGETDVDKNIHVIVIGQSRSGMSALANTLTGTREFRSGVSGSRLTKTCEAHSAERFGVKLIVYDTPGIDGKDRPVDAATIATEMQRKWHSARDVIMFIYCSRYGGLDLTVWEHFKHLFGSKFIQNTIVVLTGRDDLDLEGDGAEERILETFRERISDLPACHIITFSNKDTVLQKDEFVRNLLVLFDHLLTVQNIGNSYTMLDLEAAATLREKEITEAPQKQFEILKVVHEDVNQQLQLHAQSVAELQDQVARLAVGGENVPVPANFEKETLQRTVQS